MTDEKPDPRARQLLTGLIVVLVVFAVVLVLLDQILLAGVTFLGLALVIYLRETQ